MSLTPEELRNKVFTTVRLREGYDEDEVDGFLDEVEAEMIRLIKENDSLRAKLSAASRAAMQQPQRPAAPDQSRSGALPVLAPRPPLAGRQQFPGPIAPAAPAPLGSDHAIRVLELAGRTANETIREARAEAYRIVGEAHARAEHLQQSARSKAEGLERDAEERCRATILPLESLRIALESQVERLQSFEREYRSRLRSYLESQVHRLETSSSDALPPAQVGTAPAYAIEGHRR